MGSWGHKVYSYNHYMKEKQRGGLVMGLIVKPAVAKEAVRSDEDRPIPNAEKSEIIYKKRALEE